MSTYMTSNEQYIALSAAVYACMYFQYILAYTDTVMGRTYVSI